jgi:mono/diheme cytochrome c family protein
LSRRAAKIGKLMFLFTALLLCGAMGCWEQWSDTWFPQMKRQKAVQAFESVGFDGRVDGMLPPEGTLPVTGGTLPHDPADEAAANLLANPRSMSLASLETGRERYGQFCAPCHGDTGMGDGAVSMTGEIQGPLGGVLPLAGPASIAQVRSDGHIYATIRYGRRRMPSYQRIPSDDRWDIVNYIRYLNDQAVGRKIASGDDQKGVGQ